MARKPDKRVYVRLNRARKRIQRCRVWAPIRKTRSNALQEANLKLLNSLKQLLQQ
ncbi:MAG: hypothetical protein NZ958_01935 [Bacteroidia bacterium]|nr:hypothetical protein [Bacteroidia bacterium]MDW8089103.1 hypothetical protein [Bacteroidia bacterium]